MSDRKFSFTLEFTYKYDDDDYDYPEVYDIFGNYVRPNYEDDKFYLSTQKATAKSHLSKLSKWRDAFEELYDYDWNGSGDYMWIYIPADGGLSKKLRVFFDNNHKQMEDLADTDHYHEDGLISNYFEGIQIEFSGIDLRFRDNIDYEAYHTLRMRLLLIDAILDYCDSRSVEDIEDETWDDFKEFIRSRRALRSYFRRWRETRWFTDV
ncbi:MAG: hypothetical protein JHC26_06410 [Thermofilum sp.]|uniref:hypothetical protein n=1 Tax=Thermofilum sp. TaxID=1961369 RepID=UPI0025909A2A|nr:hypothetical protein [Thermofilum sp.]MCI4408705.1 hypothetical protein [Thermofilum sp.]